MIPSEEFERLLQAGKITAAFTLVMREMIALDVTTRMTDSAAVDQSSQSEYLHTRIDLLTGEIQNEIGRDSVTNACFEQLQQLHIDQITASQQLICEYLHQIRSILAVLPSPQIATSTVSQQLNLDRHEQQQRQIATNSESSDLLNPAVLPTRLTQAFRAILNSNSGDLDQHSPHREDLSNPEDLVQQLDRNSPPILNPPSPLSISIEAFDADLDLSVDEEGEVWEEWVEDEDFRSEPVVPYPAPPNPDVMPNWEENWVRQHLSSLPVKPTTPRVAAEQSDPYAQWDKFEPEHVGIDDDPQPNPNSIRDPYQMDLLLADLDRISRR